MQQGTYRLGSGSLLRCRRDLSGAMRCEIELPDGDRHEVDQPEEAATALLSDDPTWLVDEIRAPRGTST